MTTLLTALAVATLLQASPGSHGRVDGRGGWVEGEPGSLVVALGHVPAAALPTIPGPGSRAPVVLGTIGASGRLAVSSAGSRPLVVISGGPGGPVLRTATVIPTPSTPPNVLLILADDFGVDMVGAYAEGAAPPCTPHIDGLAADGLLFRNAWANPVCSPTRAALLTGRYGFRTGVGAPAGSAILPLAETILPEVLTGYESACFGKWHLAGNAYGPTHPTDSGFDDYAGLLGGQLQPGYNNWTKVVDGIEVPWTTYATRDTANDTIAGLQSMQEPWFLYASFSAPHAPFHVPPPALCPPATCATTYCGNLPPAPPASDRAKAMAEVMDAEIGRILNVLDAVAPNTIVIFMGDNGTPAAVSEPPFLPAHAKGSPYEGGLNVPLVVRGPGVLQGECAALTSPTDLFATVAELAQVPATAEDSVSLVPYFTDPSLSLRDVVYAERFLPNGGSPPYTTHDRGIRGDRYKLIRRVGAPDEFYDLALDPFEANDLLPAGLTPTEQAAHDELVDELVTLGVD